MTEEDNSAEAQEFDKSFVHNYGPAKFIKEGDIALCGAISTYNGDGEPDPLIIECCPICLALTKQDDAPSD